MATCGKCGYDGPFAHGCGPSPASVSLVPRVNDLEAENARLQEENRRLRKSGADVSGLLIDAVVTGGSAVSEIERENARLQTALKDLEEEPCPRRTCVHAEVRADEAEAHMGEAWQEYRRLWLRWFEERVEKRDARQLVHEARRDRDRYKALAERRKDILGLMQPMYCMDNCNTEIPGDEEHEGYCVEARAAIEEEEK